MQQSFNCFCDLPPAYVVTVVRLAPQKCESPGHVTLLPSSFSLNKKDRDKCTLFLLVEDLRLEMGSNPEKTPGRKFLVPLESSGYAVQHTRSLTMRLLGKISSGASKLGCSY